MNLKKLNEYISLLANVGVLLGIFVVAIELQQNTNAIKSQTRDSLSEKQMDYMSWPATTPELAIALLQVQELDLGNDSGLTDPQELMVLLYTNAMFREWENSFYQYEQGLFSDGDFIPRRERWVRSLRGKRQQQIWELERETFSVSFRSEIDSIVAAVRNVE